MYLDAYFGIHNKGTEDLLLRHLSPSTTGGLRLGEVEG